MQIYKRKEIFYVRGTVANRRINRSLRTRDEQEARARAAQIAAREWQRDQHGPESVLTFAQAVTIYAEHGKSVRFLEPLLRYFKESLVRSIKPGHIRQAAMELYPNGSPATRNRQVITPMQAVINHAADMELCAPIRVKRFPSRRTIKPVVDLDYIERFTEYESNPRIEALAWFMFLTGCRITPALRLTWADLDLEAGKAVLRKPKGQDDKVAHIPAMLGAKLAALERTGLRVFGYEHRWSVYKPWKATAQKAGLDYIPPHSMGRHSFATGLLRAGVDPVTIAKHGHWNNARQVLETYGHAIDDPTITERLLKK